MCHSKISKSIRQQVLISTATTFTPLALIRSWDEDATKRLNYSSCSHSWDKHEWGQEIRSYMFKSRGLGYLHVLYDRLLVSKHYLWCICMSRTGYGDKMMRQLALQMCSQGTACTCPNLIQKLPLLHQRFSFTAFFTTNRAGTGLYSLRSYIT